jgi:transcriptional regulator with XRE-family HTH domain
MPHSQDVMSAPNDTDRAAQRAAQRKVVGERIAWARQHFYRYRSDLARALGVDVSTIRKIEDGDRSPSEHLLERICHSLGISRDYVMHGRLDGVDPVLAARLLHEHPELVPAVARKGNPGARKDLARSKEQLAVAIAHIIEAFSNV